MNNTIKYKDYIGSVEFSEEDGCFFGSVQGIRSLISYEGSDARSLVEDFHDAVDSYLEMCREKGENPEKAYKGSFNVRVPAELHREAVLYGISHDMSLNKVVEEALQRMVSRKSYSGASLLCEESVDNEYRYGKSE